MNMNICKMNITSSLPVRVRPTLNRGKRETRVNVKANIGNSSIPYIDFGTLSRDIKDDKVEKMIYNKNTSDTLVTIDDQTYSSKVVLTEGVLSDITDHNVKLYIDDTKPPDYTVFFSLMIPIVFYVVFLAISRRSGGAGGMPSFMQQKNDFEIEETDITFDDVAGIDAIRNEVSELVSFVKTPDAFTESGAKIPKGCLLSGPPGTGKTLLAKAIAGEADVPFLACSASQFVEVFVGVGASRIRSIFEKARSVSPCILFIDEIDAIGKKRGGSIASSGGNDEREQTLNQLLTEMDGFNENSGVIVIAATNRREILDDALTRPGRFDRNIELPLPDIKGREKILRVHAKNKELDDDVVLKNIAKKTAGQSGAQLENIMNEAAIMAARNSRTMIKKEDIDEAYDKMTIGLPTGRVYTEEQMKRVAYHEAGHAIVGILSNDFDDIEKVSILPRGSAGGVTVFVPDENAIDGWYTKSYLLKKIRVGLGGHAAEELIYGSDEITNGAVSDFELVTNIATTMVKRFGFSDVGKFSISDDASQDTKMLVDKAVRDIVTREYNDVKFMLEKYRKSLDTMSELLVTHETIDGTDAIKILHRLDDNDIKLLME